VSGNLDPKTAQKWDAVIKNVRAEYLSQDQLYPWIIGFSGGKDSTLVVQALFEALETISPSNRLRDIHIVSNDTLVESPLVIAHLNRSSEQIRLASESLELPITVARTIPEIDKTFWVLLIGKGYPSPNSSMRWCTDRLKISPTSTYIKRNISEHGAAIVVLGVRRSESASRTKSVDKHQNIENTNLSPHTSLVGAYVYRPIVDLDIDDVWEVLGGRPSPWGVSHRELIQLYRDADGGECPVVMSKDEAPGCGTNSSRFGCWTCTVIEKDKSLQGFIDSGKEIYKPLAEFRDWLWAIRNNPEMRSAIRRNGRLTFDPTGKHIPGPFTIQARKEILDRLLKTQEQFGGALISNEEIDLIHRIWSEELQNEGNLANA
jgi:DNA sulfur modification protein DndC